MFQLLKKSLCLFLCGHEDRHEHGVGFLIHKDTVNAIMGCRPVTSRLITIRLKASPFNITIIQAYAPSTDYDDDGIEDIYDQLQEVIDQAPKKDIIVVQGDWKTKTGQDASKNWNWTCGQCCNPETNERGLRLLEFAVYNNLKVVNTVGQHKPSVYPVVWWRDISVLCDDVFCLPCGVVIWYLYFYPVW